MSDEILIKAERVKKKFCRGLRKSLQYGLWDIAGELFGRSAAKASLREDEFWALEDVSLELRRGECLGLIGHNGAGKTTLLKLLNGLLKPDAGWITVRGRVGALIALGAGFNPILSGRENVYVNGAVLGMNKAEIEDKFDSIVDFAEIGEFIDAPVQSYSSGMAVRLGFAIAIHCHPDILLLDEVLAVGDTAFQAKCFNTLGKFREQGVGFILVSHNMSAINCFCNRVLYLKHGRVAFTGETQAGVAAYNRDMVDEAQFARPDGGAIETVCGSGRMIMRRVVFLDAEGNEVTEIRTGDRVTLRIQYQCRAPEVPFPLVDIFIRDQGGVFMHIPNTIRLDVVKGSGDIDVTFESIPANNQTLGFNIALLSQRSSEIFDFKENVTLRVHGHSHAQGRIYLPCSWTVTQTEAQKPKLKAQENDQAQSSKRGIGVAE